MGIEVLWVGSTPRHRGVVGGPDPQRHHSLLWVNCDRAWQPATQTYPNTTGTLLAVRHKAVLVGGRLCVVGGGAFCFSFGTVFGATASLPLRDLQAQLLNVGLNLQGGQGAKADAVTHPGPASSTRPLANGVDGAALGEDMAETHEGAREGVMQGAKVDTVDAFASAEEVAGIMSVLAPEQPGMEASEVHEAPADAEEGLAFVVARPLASVAQRVLRGLGWLDMQYQYVMAVSVCA